MSPVAAAAIVVSVVVLMVSLASLVATILYSRETRRIQAHTRAMLDELDRRRADRREWGP